jgi:hypothetical protein
MTEKDHRKELVYLLPEVPNNREVLMNDKEDLALMLSIIP